MLQPRDEVSRRASHAGAIARVMGPYSAILRVMDPYGAIRRVIRPYGASRGPTIRADPRSRANPHDPVPPTIPCQHPLATGPHAGHVESMRRRGTAVPPIPVQCTKRKSSSDETTSAT